MNKMKQVGVIFIVLFFPIVIFAQNEMELRKSAEKGDSNAQLELARILLESHKLEEAERWLLCSAKQDNEMAQVFLGVYYEMFCENYEEAIKWFMKAGEQGNGEALYSIGDFYAEGKGVKKDTKKAFYYYDKSSKCGYSNGMNMMALALLYGGIEDFVIERDIYKAKELFKISAELGNMVGQRWLGICYLEGLGVEKNRDEAIKWLNKAKEQGDEEAKNIQVNN
ncbi:MAG: sel1 repeat family protein [Bacteroides sp.]|nr:sel1 repeat family protein [Bacteroides sp.]